MIGTPRIVILDEVVEVRNCHKILLGWCFKQAALVEFEDGDAAWDELSRTEPDLLITGC